MLRSEVALALPSSFVILQLVEPRSRRKPDRLGYAPWRHARRTGAAPGKQAPGGVGGFPAAVSGLVTLAVLALSAACSDAPGFGTQRVRPGEGTFNPSLGDGTGATSGPSSTGSVAPTAPTTPAVAPTVDELGDPFEEQACPNDVQRVHVSDCDPLGEQTQCADGEGCYPYVEYPSSRCEPETFGTRCDMAGTSTQGQPCAGERCAHGFLCVVTGRGTECAQLCRMPGPNTCPAGFICGSLDIDGFGVCI